MPILSILPFKTTEIVLTSSSHHENNLGDHVYKRCHSSLIILKVLVYTTIYNTFRLVPQYINSIASGFLYCSIHSLTSPSQISTCICCHQIGFKRILECNNALSLHEAMLCVRWVIYGVSAKLACNAITLTNISTCVPSHV